MLKLYFFFHLFGLILILRCDAKLFKLSDLIKVENPWSRMCYIILGFGVAYLVGCILVTWRKVIDLTALTSVDTFTSAGLLAVHGHADAKAENQNDEQEDLKQIYCNEERKTSLEVLRGF